MRNVNREQTPPKEVRRVIIKTSEQNSTQQPISRLSIRLSESDNNQINVKFDYKPGPGDHKIFTIQKNKENEKLFDQLVKEYQLDQKQFTSPTS